ncbi:YceD family protein [Candidatus Nitrospira inopinata]|uniref:DUF177 domain-containing protein n=1 Tax=Candidatus Nitrospira inopinata TaxID=1715989 RepID=A0A0S4KLK2_9BACT|nr:DUF177 domain-containing protein [Candidatus Nitrospira inopinata]CUQ65239.1 conserved protein of unknown function [Candidatus Nitrospira inopinata]
MSASDGARAPKGGSGALSEDMMDLLTPKVSDIVAHARSLSGDLTAEELGLTEADLVLRGTLAVGLDFRVVGKTICVTGVVEGTAIRQCVRCLKDFDDPLAFALHAAYERESKPTASAVKHEAASRRKSASAVQVKPEEESDDDLYYYSGDHLELAPMLREQLILASPMHPLCNPDCLGLCPQCGKDLNEGPCRCVAESAGGPFQALRGMRQKNQGPASR